MNEPTTARERLSDWLDNRGMVNNLKSKTPAPYCGLTSPSGKMAITRVYYEQTHRPFFYAIKASSKFAVGDIVYLDQVPEIKVTDIIYDGKHPKAGQKIRSSADIADLMAACKEGQA